MTREEAIEVYNGLINTKIKEAFEFFVPELAESEDERIRKHIVTFIMEADRRGEAPEECAKWLAYLEKQKMEGNFRCAKVNDEPIPSEPHSVNLPKGVEINGVPESEDERARMWLYDYIFNCPNENFAFYGGVGKQAVLAWLEKQKDNKFAPRVLPCSAAWFEDGEERQKEQKPNYCHYGGDPNVERCKLCSAVCIGRLTEDQKPVEWSEVELEFRGEKVKVKRPFFRDDKGRGYSTTEQDEDVAWGALRAWCEKKGISLYDLYPSTEWGEEDEKMLEEIINHIYTTSVQRIPARPGSDIGKSWIKFLKSLHNRPKPSDTWKPSEEQMEALNYAIAEWDGGKRLEGLYALRTDLKKLI